MPKKSVRVTSSKKNSAPRFRLPARRFPRMIIFIVAFSLFGLVAIFVSASSPVDSNFITGVTDMGTISQPVNYLGRDGGDSALVGGKVTWIFGDTLYAPAVPTFTGDLFRSATAAIGDVTNPTKVTDPLDSRKAPNQLIPHTPEEQAYNIAKRSGNDRYALWPSTIITRSDGNTAWVYFNNLLISGGKWVTQGTGIAVVGANSTLATRQPGYLFAPSEPPFRKAMAVGNMVYVYAGSSGQSLCEVSRVPLNQAGTRSAYQFWNGTAWVSSISQAKKVIPCSNLGFSVMYNRALKSYVEAIIPNYSKAVYFSYASAPEGPWSTPIKGFDLPNAAKSQWLYVPNMHPELSNDGDRSVYLTYSGDGTSVRMLKIALQPPVSGEPASKLATESYGSAVPAPAASTPPPRKATQPKTAAPAPANPTPSASTAVVASPAQPTSSTTNASTEKLSWWKRINLYMRRQWNAVIESLSN